LPITLGTFSLRDGELTPSVTRAAHRFFEGEHRKWSNKKLP
jgi:hypothetical protein